MRRLLMIQDLYKAKRSLELKWEQEHLSNGRYTLEMVRIDDKVKQIITDIKLEEAAIAHKQNTVEGIAPQVSVCLLYTSPSPRDRQKSRMPSSA